MAISERERLALYQRLQEQLGDESAGTLMELLPPVGWGDIATRADLQATATELRGEMAELRGEMAEVRGEMAEVRGEMAEVRGEVAELRGEMREGFAALELRIAAGQRAQVLWLLAFAVTVWVSILGGALIG